MHTSDPASSSPNRLDSLRVTLNRFQQNHGALAFSYAVIKKYGDDEAGNEGVLLTYYGFLSLFPLLVVALSVAQLTVLHGVHLASRVTSVLNHYFPLFGSQLAHNIHVQHKATIALVVSAVVTLYGARGVAMALQQVTNHVWEVPRQQRSGSWRAIARSLSIIVVGGAGFILAEALSTAAAGLGQSLLVRVLAVIISMLIIFAAVIMTINLSLSPKRPLKDLVFGSLLATIGFQIIQSVGGFIVSRELHKLSSLYGSFALVIGIIFWIYLLSRILLYAMEANTVRQFHLWPRSLDSHDLTPADKQAMRLYAEREQMVSDASEDITVTFR